MAFSGHLNIWYDLSNIVNNIPLYINVTFKSIMPNILTMLATHRQSGARGKRQIVYHLSLT